MAIEEETVKERGFAERNVGGNVAEKANVFLQPVAAPSILGMLAFAGTTFMISAWMVGWYGSFLSPLYLAPFVAVFGGIAQLIAAVWSFRARDGLATAIHGTWGSFYLAYGVLWSAFILQPQLIPRTLVFRELGFWFIVVAAISWVLSLAAMGLRSTLASVVMFVSGGATLTAIALLTGTMWCAILGGYLFMIASLCALYDGSAQVLKEVYGHEILKIGYTKRVLDEPEIMVGTGEPGVIHGQR